MPKSFDVFVIYSLEYVAKSHVTVLSISPFASILTLDFIPQTRRTTMLYGIDYFISSSVSLIISGAIFFRACESVRLYIGYAAAAIAPPMTPIVAPISNAISSG